MGRTSKRLRLPAVALAAMLVLGLAAVGAGGAPPAEDPGERLVLRLHDLPSGFFPLDLSEGAEEEVECEEIRPSDPGPRLKSFVRRYSPEGCLVYYLRAYRAPLPGPIPTFAASGAMDAGSDAAADTGFALAGALLANLAEEPLEEVTPPETVGEGSRLFHWKHVPRFIDNGRLGSFLVWRSGNVLAVVFANAGTLAAGDRIAIELAKRQQAHILDPTPYTRAERYARDVWLDDPALTLPVYWLGRTFKPGHGLPTARLEGATLISPRRVPGSRGQKLVIGYSQDLFLSSWTRAGWRRFLATDEDDLRTWHCTESTEVEIPNGRASVFAAYRRDFEVCPDRPPDRFFAFAYLGNTVTAVNFVSCQVCSGDFYGRFNSLQGMKAIVRGLTLRPEPVYVAAGG